MAAGYFSTGHPFFGFGWPLLSLVSVVLLVSVVRAHRPAGEPSESTDLAGVETTGASGDAPGWAVPLLIFASICLLTWCGYALIMMGELSW